MFSYGLATPDGDEAGATAELATAAGGHGRERLERLEELSAALTPRVLRRVRTYARRRARVLALAGRAPRDAQVDALVLAVVVAAVRDASAWDQARSDLAAHLCAELRRAMPVAARRDAREPAWHDRPFDLSVMTAPRVRIAARVVAALYDSAVTERGGEVVRMLDGFREGAERRAEFATQLGVRVRSRVRDCGPARGRVRRGLVAPTPSLAAALAGPAGD